MAKLQEGVGKESQEILETSDGKERWLWPKLSAGTLRTWVQYSLWLGVPASQYVKQLQHFCLFLARGALEVLVHLYTPASR